MNQSRPKFDLQRPKVSAQRKQTAQPVVFEVLPKITAVKKTQVLAPSYRSNTFAGAISKTLPMILIMSLALGTIQLGGYLNSAQQASGVVLGSATTAYDNLDSATQSLNAQDFDSAKLQFTQAQKSLEEAQTQLGDYKLLTLLAPPAKGADNILTGAYFLAEAGKNLARAMQLFDSLSVSSEGIADQTFTQQLAENKQLLQNSLLMLSYAQEKFDSATGVPSSYDDTLAHAKEQITVLNKLLTNLVQLEDLFLSFFGTEPKTYLLVFQNNDELRATGGFIGTYGRLKYQNGEILDLKIESVYNIDGSLTKQIAAPGPFQPYITKWAMRDANWFADFPTSAKKLLEFYEMEAETADGIIALTPNIFKDILELTGPIQMDYYGVTLTSENFQEEVQAQTSVEYDKELNEPKKFLDDFAPIMLNRLSGFSKEQWFAVFGIIKNNFSQKHILMYSKDQGTQNKIAAMDFDGRILEAPHDYLSIINTNLGGTKTDLDIIQKINYSSAINSDGTITNTVTVTRENTTQQANGNFVRVLVPLGSRLVSSEGFIEKPQPTSMAENFTVDNDLAQWDKGRSYGNAFVRTESGKTAITGWTETLGGATTVYTVKYLLPLKIETSWLHRTQGHSLVFQKQPGSVNSTLQGEWLANNFKVKWSGQNTVSGSGKAVFQSTGLTDESWGVIFSR